MELAGARSAHNMFSTSEINAETMFYELVWRGASHGSVCPIGTQLQTTLFSYEHTHFCARKVGTRELDAMEVCDLGESKRVRNSPGLLAIEKGRSHLGAYILTYSKSET